MSSATTRVAARHEGPSSTRRAGGQASAAGETRRQTLPVERPAKFTLVEETAHCDPVAVDVSLAHVARIVDIVGQHRLPAMYPFHEFAEAGGLMSYGVSFHQLLRRTAAYVDQILKGIKAGELPVERPAKLALVINLKTAKALGLTISPSLLARADRVIQ